MFVRLFPVPEEVSQEHKGQGDTEPHGPYTQHGGKGDRPARVLAPDEKVDEDADTEDYTRVEGSGQQSRSLNTQTMLNLIRRW